MLSFNGLLTTMKPKIGVVVFPWVGAMAVFAAILYGDFSDPIYMDAGFYLRVFLVVLAAYLGTTSGYAVNDYFDAELDLTSTKRKDKAVRKGVSKNEILAYTAILGIPCILIMFYLSPLMGIVGLMQMFCIIVYSKYLKRRTPFANILVVIPTALMPMGAFFAFTDAITIEMCLMAAVYFFYEPGFTWSGTCRDVPTDIKENLPTLPITFGIKNVAKFIMVCWVLTLIASVALFLFTDLGLIYLAGSVASALMLIRLADAFVKNPEPGTGATTFFKSSRWFWYFSIAVMADLFLGLLLNFPNINFIG